MNKLLQYVTSSAAGRCVAARKAWTATTYGHHKSTSIFLSRITGKKNWSLAETGFCPSRMRSIRLCERRSRAAIQAVLCAACILVSMPLHASAAVFSFSPSLEAPVLVRAFPNAGDTRLTWLPASSTSPVSYKIYSRRSDEPDFYPIGTATVPQFDTSYTFAGVDDTVTRLYEVSAVAADGTESALSDAVMDNDQDGDGVTDAREAEYNTLVANADTDGDGLTDGQELFIYHTDPLDTDTDNDGVNDYDAVINEMRANLPPYAVDDHATSTVPAGATVGDPVVVAVLLNDIGGIATSTLAVTTQPAHGAAALTTTASTSAQYGSITYTPATGFSGTDSFVYTIANQNGLTSTASVSVVVPTVSSGGTTTPTVPLASTTPVSFDTTSFVQMSGNTASVAHTVGAGSASTTDRVLICGTSAQDASGNNVSATSLTFGTAAFTRVSTYLAAPTTSTTPTEFWYLKNPAVGSGTVTLTAPAPATKSSIVCTSLYDFYWYIPEEPFTWVPNTGATSTPPAATTTPPMSTSTAPISFDTTSFVRTSGASASVAHTVAQGSATTTYRTLVCGTSAHDASGSNVPMTSLTYGSLPFTHAAAYGASPTSTTTPTEMWYLENAPVGTATITATAASTAATTAAVCTSFTDFYWYIPGRAFTW